MAPIGGFRTIDRSMDTLDSYNGNGNTTIININSNNNNGNVVDSGNEINSRNIAKNKSSAFGIGNMLAGVVNLVSGIFNGGSQNSFLGNGRNGLLDFIC